MHLIACTWLLIVANLARVRADDPKPPPPPASPVRVRLEAARAAVERAASLNSEEGEKIRAGDLPAAEKARLEAASDARYYGALAGAMDDLLAAATGQPDDPASVEALGFVALRGRGLRTGQVEWALVALKRDHARAPGISAATRALFVNHDRPEATALLRAVIAANPDRVERGRACHDLAFLQQYHLKPTDPADGRAEVEATYERCLAEFADVPVVGYGAGRTVGDFARGALFDLRHLQVGMVAPDIVGRDVEGRPLRLGDHRGRPVVLIFSGEWCGPCRGTAPFLRALLTPEAQKSAPCVVLEVNTDETRDPIRRAIAAGEVAWPCWFDGGVTGPITMGWGVESFPLTFILDAEGVIRAKNVPGDALARTLADVLKDRPAAGRP